MGKTTRNNAAAKAAQTFANAQRKNASLSAAERNRWYFEYVIAHSTDPKVCPHDLQALLLEMFDRYGL